MSYLYVDPYEKLQENIQEFGEGLGQIAQKKKNQQLINQMLSTMSPEEQSLFAGITDPETFATQRINFHNSLKDDIRADKTFALDEEKTNAAILKEENERLDKMYAQNEISGNVYAQAKTDLYKKYGKGRLSWEVNPNYNVEEAKKNPIQYTESPVRVKPLADIQMQQFKEKEDYKNQGEVKKNKEVENIKYENTKKIKSLEHKNKISEIGVQGVQAIKTKQSPNFKEKKIEERRAKEEQEDLEIDQMKKKIFQKLREKGMM